MSEAEQMPTGVRATARTDGAMHGALKALCEQTAEQRMPGRVLNVRPDRIVGPDDYTDGLTFRPLAETIRAAMTWDGRRSQDEPMKAGLSPEREQELHTHAPHPAY